jgi:hypothetical protein
MRLSAPWAKSALSWRRSKEEKFVSECYVFRVEISRPIACEKPAVETMYHLQQSAYGRSVATLGAVQSRRHDFHS